ncbi:MAG: TonB-dependent receptor, partial [Deltaproteobacteria bacterium]|nr:TonB-dependent receptor [Deltaproteobacteria bacterium]
MDDQTVSDTIDYYLNLKYEATLWEGIDLFAKIYRNHHELSGPGIQIPGGAYRSWFGDAPFDLIQDYRVKGNRTGFEVQTNYETGSTNTIIAGITFEEQEQYDVELYANFLDDGTVFSSIRDVSDMQNHNRDATRDFKAVFLEDIWNVTNNFRLTVGGRYDYYSDFGDHFSPRAGLTWEYIKGYDLKLLYGHAFRAPSFAELYAQYYGNPDLGPETVDTYELSLGAQFTPPFGGRATFYRSDMKDGIGMDVVDGGLVHWDNVAEVKYERFEFELKYNFRRGNYLAANYTYQTFDFGDGDDGGMVPT